MVKKRRYKGQEVYQYTGIGLNFGFSTERGTWEPAGCPSPAEASPAPTSDIAVYEQECDQSQEPVEYYLDIGNCGIKIPIDMSSNLHLRWVSGFNYQGPVQRDPYIGGVGTIRGYAHKAFSDQSVWLCNVEYEFILGGWDGKMSNIFLFTDFGSHYLRESRDWFVDDPNYFENFKQSIGMGFDWAGIRLYYAKPLDGGSDFSLGIELEGQDHEPYPAVQYQVLTQLIQTLLKQYPTIAPEALTGHCDIAPDRKTDPGPAFDWKKLYDSLNRT